MKGDGAVLFACASGLEAEGLEGARVLGVGKVEAALSMRDAIDERRPDAVVLFGLAGAFPERHVGRPVRAAIRGLAVCRTDRFGDEGVMTEGGFLDLESLGIGGQAVFEADRELTARCAELLGAPLVSACTVSTGSGSERLSAALAARTGADLETMEGAAVAAACARARVPFAQVRCVSNWTGDRARSCWDRKGALAALRGAVERLRRGIGGPP
ncbi:MAG: futalosine hydrolase [Planctomycetota bacterium]